MKSNEVSPGIRNEIVEYILSKEFKAEKAKPSYKPDKVEWTCIGYIHNDRAETAANLLQAVEAAIDLDYLELVPIFEKYFSPSKDPFDNREWSRYEFYADEHPFSFLPQEKEWHCGSDYRYSSRMNPCRKFDPAYLLLQAIRHNNVKYVNDLLKTPRLVNIADTSNCVWKVTIELTFKNHKKETKTFKIYEGNSVLATAIEIAVFRGHKEIYLHLAEIRKQAELASLTGCLAANQSTQADLKSDEKQLRALQRECGPQRHSPEFYKRIMAATAAAPMAASATGTTSPVTQPVSTSENAAAAPVAASATGTPNTSKIEALEKMLGRSLI